jgi:probable rRNA maturation factor
MDDDDEQSAVTVVDRCVGRVRSEEFDPIRLRRLLERAIEASGLPVERLHIEIVDDAEMDRLHRAHSGLPGTTDVLTFPQSLPGEPIDADVAICLDEALRQAAEFGHDAAREVLLYAVHALLHCAGHDDHDPAAFARMHAEEDRILRAIGVGATFRPEGGFRP